MEMVLAIIGLICLIIINEIDNNLQLGAAMWLSRTVHIVTVEASRLSLMTNDNT